LTSLWNYKFYHVYGFLLGVYAILTIVVGMTSIIVVYFCLNAENYLWQWTAFGSGASTAGYVFLYGIYYFIFKTQMHGFLQVCFYFGYMTLIAVNLGLLCGTLGHAAASRFVRAIFSNVKVD
jgi:transmembrane 9 superfamily protein 3